MRKSRIDREAANSVTDAWPMRRPAEGLSVIRVFLYRRTFQRCFIQEWILYCICRVTTRATFICSKLNLHSLTLLTKTPFYPNPADFPTATVCGSSPLFGGGGSRWFRAGRRVRRGGATRLRSRGTSQRRCLQCVRQPPARGPASLAELPRSNGGRGAEERESVVPLEEDGMKGTLIVRWGKQKTLCNRPRVPRVGSLILCLLEMKNNVWCFDVLLKEYQQRCAFHDN